MDKISHKKIMGSVLEATILNGKFEGKVVLLPRIPMIPLDSPIPFRRLQFSIRLAFAMTINKSQGQTMSICGLDQEKSALFTWPIICGVFSRWKTVNFIHLYSSETH